MEKDILDLDEVVEEKEPKKNFVVVNCTLLNLRTGPGFKEPVSKVLPQGTKLEVLKRQKEWVLVKLTDGEKSLKGYVKSEFVDAFAGK